MSSLNSLSSRLAKVKESLPPSPKERETDVSLFTEQEREQVCAFVDSLPRPLDLQALNDDQLDERRHWLKLEEALYKGDMAEAEKLRKRHSVTLEQLVDRFLNLDISSIPDGKVLVDTGRCYSHVSYRDIRINYIERGKARRRIDDIWRWVEYFNG